MENFQPQNPDLSTVLWAVLKGFNWHKYASRDEQYKIERKNLDNS